MPPIIVRYSDQAHHWLARFDGSPSVRSGSNIPMDAVRRLLQGNGTPPGDVMLHVDQDQAGSALLSRAATWQPPELLFKCTQCNRWRAHTRPSVVETCRACRGRGFIAD